MFVANVIPSRARQSWRHAAVAALATAVCTLPAQATVQLSKEAEQAFYHYVTMRESHMQSEAGQGRFLWMDSQPEARAKARTGERLILPAAVEDHAKAGDPPNALIQDWLGAIFLPKTTAARVREVMEDYPHYKTMFAPDIIESSVLKREPGRFQVALRLYKRQLLTVVLNTNYDIRYGEVDARRFSITSRSTRIAELKNPKPPYSDEYRPGDDTGFLWKLNSYWRFEEADGGVYAECEAISLSRDVPFGLGWMIRKFVEKFPKESMENTLKSVKRAVETK